MCAADTCDVYLQLVSGLDSRLGQFEARVDGSLSELQAKVTLMEGRLKFVERTPAIGGLTSASALSAASAPASPIKEPDAACVLATLHCCASPSRSRSNRAVPTRTFGRAAPKPTNVICTPAAPPEGVSASSQPKAGMANQLDDSYDDTLDFVEAVAARFSGMRHANYVHVAT